MSIEIIQEMKAITLFAIFFLIYVASADRPFQAGGCGALSPAELKHIRGKVEAALKKTLIVCYVQTFEDSLRDKASGGRHEV